MMLFFDVSFREAFTYDMPFWLGDLVKTTLVAIIAAEVHRAFPRLLPATDLCRRSSSRPRPSGSPCPDAASACCSRRPR